MNSHLSFHPIRMEYGGTYGTIESLRSSAENTYNSRKAQSSQDHLFLVDDWWHIQAYSELDQIHDVTANNKYWLKINADNTYLYGMDEAIEGRGKFHYQDSDGALLLIDDNPKVEPVEFNLRYASDKMVFIGMSSMGVNNGSQIMMVLLSNPPILN